MDSFTDHKTLLAKLDPEMRRALCTQSDGQASVRLAIHLGLIAGFGGYILSGGPFWQAALVLQGILLVFLFTALHEFIHRTAFRTGRLNDWAAFLCGFAIVLTPAHFRYFHLAHHRFTHDPDRDPELATGKPGTLAGYFWMLSGLPDCYGRLRTLIRNAARESDDPFVPSRGRGRVRREAVLFLCLYAGLLAAFGQALFWIWILPLLLGGPFLRAYLLAEHARCPHVADMLTNTRTTMTNRLVRWIAWNMPYHAEHHAFPAVPFHNLPRLHGFMGPHLKTTAPGYLPFNAEYVRAAKTGDLPNTKGCG